MFWILDWIHKKKYLYICLEKYFHNVIILLIRFYDIWSKLHFNDRVNIQNDFLFWLKGVYHLLSFFKYILPSLEFSSTTSSGCIS